MWKRDEAVKPPQQSTPTPSTPTTTGTPQTPSAAATTGTGPQQGRGNVNIGKSVIIKGELSGSEDLTIEGQVEGKIELRQNVLTIGANGRIKAQVFAKAVVVQGHVTGDITATERVDIRDNGSVDGDLVSPRVAIADGSHFRGSIDMQRQGSKGAGAADSKPAADAKPAESRPAVAAASGR